MLYSNVYHVHGSSYFVTIKGGRMYKICKGCNKCFNAKHIRINNCNDCFNKFIEIEFKSFDNYGYICRIAGIKTYYCINNHNGGKHVI